MKTEALYREFAEYYDKVYFRKNYKKEVDFIDKIIKKSRVSGKSVLDVACGTGNHAKIMVKKGYLIIGVDKNPQILKMARKKIPSAVFKRGDMRNFKITRKFDIVLCMFTAINYNLTRKDLTKTLKNFKKHVKDDGIVIFDFPLKRISYIDAEFLGKDAVILYTPKKLGRVTEILVYWIFNKKKKPTVFEDLHRIRFYSLSELSQAIKQAGMKHNVYWDFSLSKKKGKRPIIVCRK